MPPLVRLYLTSIVIGFLLALVFTGLLLAADIAGLRHLVLSSGAGWLGGLMLVFFHTILFSAVQFAFAVMHIPDRDGQGGKRIPYFRSEKVPIVVRKASRSEN
jgi:hypothetical protein